MVVAQNRDSCERNEIRLDQKLQVEPAGFSGGSGMGCEEVRELEVQDFSLSDWMDDGATAMW